MAKGIWIIIFTGYDNDVQSKLVAEVWECSKIYKKKSNKLLSKSIPICKLTSWFKLAKVFLCNEQLSLTFRVI